MSFLLGVLVVVVGLVVSVALHEIGHMVPAKRFGVLVPVYSVGFGPILWQRAWRGTTYMVRAVLLGGYVRIVGMFAPARAGTPTLNRKGRPTLAQEARLASAAEVPEGQEAHAFHRLSAPRKVVVMLGGPVMNLLICVVLLAVAMMGIGSATPSTRLQEVTPTVHTTSGDVTGPASRAGMRAGDRIVSWNGEETPTWSDVREQIADSTGAEVSVVVEREGQQVDLSVTPVRNAEGGWAIGILAGYDFVHAGPGDVVSATWRYFTGTTSVVVRLPQAVWDVGRSLFTSQERDPNGIVSVVGVGRVAGEITQAGDEAGAAGARQSAAALLMLLASLNMALFVFNLIPLPPLDGGHVAGAVFEGARRSLARLRGRPDPGPADTARLMPLTYGVGVALIAMTVLLVAADVIDPVRLF